MIVEDEGVAAFISITICTEGADGKMVFGAAAFDMADIAGKDVLTLAVLKAGIDAGKDGFAAVTTVPAFVAEVVQDDVLKVLWSPGIVRSDDIEVHSHEEVVSKVGIGKLPVSEGVTHANCWHRCHNAGSDGVLIIVAQGRQDFFIDNLRRQDLIVFGFAPIYHCWEPLYGNGYIGDIQCFREQLRHILIFETGDAAANSREKETVHRMLFGVLQEFIDIGLDLRQRTVHCGDGIALTLRAYALSPDCAEFVICNLGRTAEVLTFQIASLCKRLHKGAYVKSEIM